MNNTQNCESVLQILKNYRILERKIRILRFQLQDVPAVPKRDTAESIANTAKSLDTEATSDNVPDKAVLGALHLGWNEIEVNQQRAKKRSVQLSAMRHKKDELDLFISLLESKQCEVIDKLYRHGMTNEQVADQMGLTSRTVQNIRKKAVENLAAMYRFAAESG
ncbi:sigma factor-like helix-turn-helix DNA-binding protein [Dysosmobacter sp.]